jgi:hypothetical protein
MNQTWRKYLPLSVVFLAGAGGVDAAQPKHEVEPAYEYEQLEEIVVRGRWDRPNGLAISASQGSVSQEEIAMRPILRPGDILEVVPGLIVTQHSGTGKSNQMFLRGFNLDHGTDFATWIDGMPINMPSHGHGQGYTDLNFIIPELVDSVEFRKGPYYSDISDFSSAGAAFFSMARSLNSRIIKVGLGEDGFGQFLYADSLKTESGELLFGLQSSVYDGPWVGTSEDIAKHSAVVRYSQSVPDVGEWDVMLMAYDAEWNSADQIPYRAVESGFVDRLGTIDDTVGGETHRYSISGGWHRDFDDRQVSVQAYAINYGLNLFSNFTYFLDDPIRGDQFEQVDERNIFGGNVVWQVNSSDRSRHKYGVNLRIDQIGNVGLFNSESRVRLDVARQDKVSQLSSGLFYDFEYAWKDSWRAILGVRADYYQFDVKQSNIDLNTGTADDFLISPKLNIVRTLSSNTEAYFSAGAGFHSNDARGTVISIDPGTGESTESVDPMVKSRGAELGVRYFDTDRLNVSASLWLLDLDSELLFVGDAGNTEPSRSSRRYGIEVPAYYRLNDEWMFDLEIALTESEFTESSAEGDEIPGSIERVVSAGVVRNFENGLYGTLRVRHFGDRPLNEDGSVWSGASTIYNLGLGYSTPRFEFRLDLLNAFDSDDADIAYYYESRLPGELPSGIADTHFHPVEPRTIRAYVTWHSGVRRQQ